MKFLTTLRILLEKVFGFLKNLDSNTIKNILIIILILSTLGIGLSWYFKDDNKSLIKRLESEAKNLKDERKIIKVQIDSLKTENDKLYTDKKKIEEILKKDDEIITEYINKANKSQQDLDNLKKQQSDINKKIDQLRSHPANRQNDELIKSLKRHLNERMKNKQITI